MISVSNPNYSPYSLECVDRMSAIIRRRISVQDISIFIPISWDIWMAIIGISNSIHVKFKDKFLRKFVVAADFGFFAFDFNFLA